MNKRNLRRYIREKSKLEKELIIIGAGGHGKVVGDIAQDTGRYIEISFLDDNESLKNCGRFDVIGKVSDVNKYIGKADIFVAIGDAKIRRKICEELRSKGAEIPYLIHSEAVLTGDYSLGFGTVIMPGAIVNADAFIGYGSIVNSGAIIEHDCKIGEYAHISVGARLAGNVSIGDNTWVGVGAVVSNNVSITNDCMIGAGAVVVKDITEPGTYVGVPARKIK